MARSRSNSLRTLEEHSSSNSNSRFAALIDLVKVCNTVQGNRKHRTLLNLIELSALDALDAVYHPNEAGMDGNLPTIVHQASINQMSHSPKIPHHGARDQLIRKEISDQQNTLPKIRQQSDAMIASKPSNDAALHHHLQESQVTYRAIIDQADNSLFNSF